MDETGPPPAPKAILTPTLDALLVGGVSLIGLTFLLVAEPQYKGSPIAIQSFVILAALLNWPHFWASYRLLYGSPETVAEHRWASYWIPGLLAAACIGAVVVGSRTHVPMHALTAVAGIYLAWHYTGQTWGMMATFSFLSGGPIQPDEKRLIRGPLRYLLVWHVMFAFEYGMPPDGVLMPVAWVEPVHTLFVLVSWGVLPAAAVGTIGMLRYARRLGRMPDIRVLIPYLSIFLWYSLMAKHPAAIFWVQASHALQYLAFPLRVEANRNAVRKGVAATDGAITRRMVVPYLVLVAGGAAVLQGVPWATGVWMIKGLDGGYEMALLLGAGVSAFVNIHHYFVDGVVWKISNPRVRRELFAHVKR